MLREFKEFIRDTWPISVPLMALFAICAGVVLCIAFQGHEFEETFEATVVSKQHVPARISTGTGVGPKGEVVFVTTSSPEEWIVVVKVDERIVVINTTRTKWAVAQGDISVSRYRGKIFGDASYRIEE